MSQHKHVPIQQSLCSGDPSIHFYQNTLGSQCLRSTLLQVDYERVRHVTELSPHPSVPSRVKNLQVSGDGSSLQVSWTAGQGDVDGFTVFLHRGGRQLDVRSVLRQQHQLSFGSLQPGQKYSLTVQSVSGALVNNCSAEGHTGTQHALLSQVPSMHCSPRYPACTALTGTQHALLSQLHRMHCSHRYPECTALTVFKPVLSNVFFIVCSVLKGRSPTTNCNINLTC